MRCARSAFAVLCIVSLAVGAWSLPVPALAQAPLVPTPAAAPAEVWGGHVEVPGGVKLNIVVRFVRDAAGAVSATLDIPMQGLKDGALHDVVYDDDQIEFTLKVAGAVFSAERDGDAAKGVLKQSGMEMPLELERLDAEAAAALEPKRPQTPKPPFEYTTRDVTYENPADGTKLAGTLTIPKGEGPHPAVIFITGSGPQDRDETIFGHKPFAVIADHLAKEGIASLRVDDRGVGGSSGSLSDTKLEHYSGDVGAGIDFLGEQPEIDAGRIGLIGHSEGGIVAPAVAARRPEDVAFIVLLAGTGLPGKDIMEMQLVKILEAMGMREEVVAAKSAAQKKILALAAAGAPREEIEQAVRESLYEEFGLKADAEPPPGFEEQMAMAMAQVDSEWLKYFLVYDPRPALAKVRCPVLALNGTLDLQVPVEENLAEIERALRAGGNEDVTVTPLEGRNHLFQVARTGLIDEYGEIEQTIDPEVLEIISGWIREKAGLE